MITCLSPCKLNLCLYVLGKRPDGFHNLQSLFTPLTFGDTMTFGSEPPTLSDLQALPLDASVAQLRADGTQVQETLARCTQSAAGITLTSTQPLGVELADNLIYRAARLLQTTTGRNFTVHIGLHKRIPMGGGLGGGSSNAATTLVTLNRMLELGLCTEQLTELGARLGSDVPFFVHGTSALVEGRGEVITPLDLPPQYYLVVTPDVHVSTKAIFTDPALKEHYSAPRSHEEVLAGPYGNDLVAVVTKNFCEIGHTLERLVKYGHPAMSGTGASCFVACSDAQAAQAAFAEVTQQSLNLGCGYRVFVAHTLKP